MRKAIVYCHDTEAGFLEESTPGRGYTFTYDKQYMMDRTHDPVSLTMPFREEPYQSDYLFPVFTNMLPEGAKQKDGCRNAGVFKGKGCSDLHDFYLILLKFLFGLSVWGVTSCPLR